MISTRETFVTITYFTLQTQASKVLWSRDNETFRKSNGTFKLLVFCAAHLIEPHYKETYLCRVNWWIDNSRLPIITDCEWFWFLIEFLIQHRHLIGIFLTHDPQIVRKQNVWTKHMKECLVFQAVRWLVCCLLCDEKLQTKSKFQWDFLVSRVRKSKWKVRHKS